MVSPTKEHPVSAPLVFECDLCSYKCYSPQALSWHRYDRHSVRHSMRPFIHSNVCECCLRDFHSRERVFTHITASSKVCSRYYRENGSAVSSSVLERLEREAYNSTIKLKKQGRRRTHAREPPERMQGPLTLGAHILGVRHDCLLTKPPTGRWSSG